MVFTQTVVLMLDFARQHHCPSKTLLVAVVCSRKTRPRHGVQGPLVVLWQGVTQETPKFWLVASAGRGHKQDALGCESRAHLQYNSSPCQHEGCRNFVTALEAGKQTKTTVGQLARLLADDNFCFGRALRDAKIEKLLSQLGGGRNSQIGFFPTQICLHFSGGPASLQPHPRQELPSALGFALQQVSAAIFHVKCKAIILLIIKQHVLRERLNFALPQLFLLKF